MENGLYVAGSRMNALGSVLDTVAANLANADTPGYKRAVCGFESVLARFTPNGGAPKGSAAPEYPRLVGARLDPAPGGVRRTGRPLDLAIEGGAYFAVETPRGRRYTRKGRLCVGSSGELCDSAGNRFLAESGGLTIPEGTGSVSVESNGQVVAGDQVLGKLMLSEIPRPDKLVPAGNALYRNEGPPARPATNSRVIQGAIENSNVKQVQEMVALVQVMRAYEATARVAKRLDALNSQLIKTAA